MNLFQCCWILDHINILFTCLEIRPQFVYSLQMQEKITLLQKEQEEEEEEDEANHSILVEELQHCSPDKVYTYIITHDTLHAATLKLVLTLSQRFVRQFNHLNRARLD